MQFRAICLLGVVGAVGVSGLGETPCQETAPAAASTSTEGRSSDFWYGGAPVPTDSPNTYFGELVKRQQVGGSICGVVSTATTRTNTCPVGYQCSSNTGIGYYGCCASGSCYYPTSCYDSTRVATVSCGVNDQTCTASSLYCTNSVYPYCGTYLLGSLTALACFSVPSTTQVLIPFTGGAGTVSSSSSRASSAASLSSSASVTTSVPADRGTTTSDIPFTQQQQPVPSTTTVTASSSRGLAAGFGTTGEYIYGLLMSLVLLVV